MTPDAALWMLSTMAQVSAALVGLALIAVFFLLGRLRDVTISSDAERNFISIGVLAGTPSKLVSLVLFATLFVLLMGIATTVYAVDAMSGVGEVVSDESIASIHEVRLYFGTFLALLLAVAIGCLMIGGMVHLGEVRDFERLLGGPGAVKKAIEERQKEIEDNRSKKKRSKGSRKAVKSQPERLPEVADSEMEKEEGV